MTELRPRENATVKTNQCDPLRFPAGLAEQFQLAISSPQVLDGGSQLLPPRFPPAALAAVSVDPVTMTADPEHRATVIPPAKPLT